MGGHFEDGGGGSGSRQRWVAGGFNGVKELRGTAVPEPVIVGVDRPVHRVAGGRAGVRDLETVLMATLLWLGDVLLVVGRRRVIADTVWPQVVVGGIIRRTGWEGGLPATHVRQTIADHASISPIGAMIIGPRRVTGSRHATARRP